MIKCIFYDFDGVLTNNKVFIDQNGNEMVEVNRSDGLGVSEIKKLGIEQIILSTETNLVVSYRADKLGIECLQGIEDKRDALKSYCDEHKIDLINVAFIGNDTNDKSVMKFIKKSFCPSDAHPDIKKIAKTILNCKGGQGVAREMLDIIRRERENV
jgi:3-deoxy-D-manno-octulosonate 8-phosphate phosphatase (KDO 8-P phosphatase)